VKNLAACGVVTTDETRRRRIDAGREAAATTRAQRQRGRGEVGCLDLGSGARRQAPRPRHMSDTLTRVES
jgi:hypothetical protein